MTDEAHDGQAPIGERIRRVIDDLLDQAEEATKNREWDVVQDLARRALQIEDAPLDAVEDANRFLQIAATSADEGPGRRFGSVSPIRGREAPRPTVGSRALTSEPTTWRGTGGFDQGALVTVSPQLVELFYSYANADEELRDRLMTHLAALRRTSRWQLREWHRGMVELGQDRVSETERHLESAKIILLLITPDYMNEQADPDAEVYRALERAALGEARVVPVRLKPVTLADDSELLNLQWVPEQAVTTSDNEDTAFAAVAEGIKRVCSTLAGLRGTDVGDKDASKQR